MKNSASNALRAFARGRLAAAMVLAIGMQAAAIAAPSPNPGAAQWAMTRTHVLDTADAKFNGLAADQQPLSITVVLKLRNKDVLDSYTHELFRPNSPSYHQFLTSQESTATFAPTQAQAQAVAAYLTQQGFSNVKIAGNRLLVTAEGTVGAARLAFRTEIGQFTRNGRSAIANTQSVQVPAELSGQVDQVLGLQNLHRVQTFSWHGQMPAAARPDYTTVTSVDGNANAHGYYPQEFATVYDAGKTGAASSTGVAIIGWGSMANTVADLAQLEKDKGITAVPTSVVAFGGSNSSDTGNDDSGQGEWAMDAQAIVGISGGVKQLTFYTAYSNWSFWQALFNNGNGSSGPSDANLLAAINQAVTDNTAKVINMSWGEPECDGAPGFADTAFQLGVAQGQTFSAASGDNGSYPCNASGNGSYGDKTKLSVNYPASSPYAVAVGGTTLNTSSADSYVSETTWPYSGGGISSAEATPAWQPSSYSYRELPDLAFDADWTNTPIIYYMTASESSGVTSSGYTNNGGTSLASPLFVGAWARLESANGNKLGFAAPAIYAYAAASSPLPLHDITTGNNGAYSAAAGRDNATGWGSFDIQAINTFIGNTPGFVTASNNETTPATASH